MTTNTVANTGPSTAQSVWDSVSGVAVQIARPAVNTVGTLHEEWQQNVADSGAPIGRLISTIFRTDKAGIITSLFLSAVPVLLCYWVLPTAVAIAFWAIYELSRIAGTNQHLIDRSITIAAVFEMVYELVKFASLQLAKNALAYSHLKVAIAAGITAALFGWRAYNSLTALNPPPAPPIASPAAASSAPAPSSALVPVPVPVPAPA